MKINVRYSIGSLYVEVVVTDGNAQISTGHLNGPERIEMARNLRDVADELLYGIEVPHEKD